MPNGIQQFWESLLNSGLSIKYIDMLKEQIDSAAVIFEDIRLERQKERSLLEELESRVQNCEKQMEEQAGQDAESEDSQDGNTENELKELIGNIILFRDNQMMKRGFLYEQGEKDDSVPIRIVESILRETAGLLAKSGVEIMEDKGLFSSERQIIMDTVETMDAEMDGTIAETIRQAIAIKANPFAHRKSLFIKRRTKER